MKGASDVVVVTEWGVPVVIAMGDVVESRGIMLVVTAGLNG